MGDGTNLFLQIVEHPDGTITRPFVPLSPPISSIVESKDVPLDPALNTYLRIYRPSSPSKSKLPIVLYFHGGGFVLFSAASNFYHAHCELLAASLPALVLSLDYRLAPENRLPAAFLDAAAALRWILSPAAAANDSWIADSGDKSCIFLAGSSSGANMAYRAALGSEVDLAGLVMIQPYFGGIERTASEIAGEEDPILPLRANDMLWRLALPEGAGRDHEFCDATAGEENVERIRRLPRSLVVGCDGDPLVDRQRGFARMIETAGVRMTARFGGKGYHAMELFERERAEELVAQIRDFIYC